MKNQIQIIRTSLNNLCDISEYSAEAMLRLMDLKMSRGQTSKQAAAEIVFEVLLGKNWTISDIMRVQKEIFDQVGDVKYVPLNSKIPEAKYTKCLLQKSINEEEANRKKILEEIKRQKWRDECEPELDKYLKENFG